MKIGIDISQLAYSGTGVANYLQNLVEQLITQESTHEFILFFSSARRKLPESFIGSIKNKKNVTLKTFMFPPVALDILWNRFHIFPIEHFLGDLDIFISSDWTEPPVRNAKKATILYDLIVYTYPEETAEIIIQTQKRKLQWTRKECDMVFCISEATKQDAQKILTIADKKLSVIYPGLTL